MCVSDPLSLYHVCAALTVCVCVSCCDVSFQPLSESGSGQRNKKTRGKEPETLLSAPIKDSVPEESLSSDPQLHKAAL